MTQPVVLTGDFRNATRATGTRCTGVGEQPSGRAIWGRGTCPGCLLNQRVTESGGVMMSHYVTRANEPSADLVRVPVPEARPLTLVPSGLQEVIADLNTPNEPSTVGEFVKAIIALSGALATARIRIAELEQSPPPPPVNNDEVAQWEADWLELNHLLAYYAIERSWCPEFESVVSTWNSTHFQRGYLLSRNDVRTTNIRGDRLSGDQQTANRNTLGERGTAARARYRASRGR
jgi:hypothetical protein